MVETTLAPRSSYNPYPIVIENFATPQPWPNSPTFIIDLKVKKHVHWRVEPILHEAARRRIYVQLLTIHHDGRMVFVQVRGFKRTQIGWLFLDEIDCMDFEVLKEFIMFKMIEDFDILVGIRDQARPGTPMTHPNPVAYCAQDGYPVFTAKAQADLEKKWFWAKVEVLEPLISSAVRRVIRKLGV